MGIFNAQIKVAAKSIIPGTTGDSSYTEIVTILPANAYIMHTFGRVKTPFTGLVNPMVSLGVTGDTARYMVAQPLTVVNEFISGKLLKSSSGIRKTATYLPDKYKKDLPHSMGFCEAMPKEKISPSAKSIIATFTSSSTAFTATAGEVEFIVVYVDPN
jgi:hypothetical protein